MKQKKPDVKKLVTLSMLSAMTFVVLLLSKQIPLSAPGAPFLTFDLKDCIIIIGGLMYGPLAGAGISAIACGSGTMGALIGGGLGALAGGIYGHEKEHR